MVEDTLVDRIKKIDAIPEELVPIDKHREMIEEFEKLAKTNQIVRNIMDGKTTPLEEYERAFGEYTLRKLSTPYSLPPDFKEKNADLMACIGDPDLRDENFEGGILPRNPVAGLSYAVLGGVIPLAYNLFSNPEKRMDRRRFMKDGLLFASFTGVLGISYGADTASETHYQLNTIKENAEYLHEISATLFKN